MTERWRMVVDNPNYEVSSQGRVRRVAPGQGVSIGRFSTPHLGNSGYLHVSLRYGKTQRNRMIHILVAEAFIGPRPENKGVNHKDLNKLNNNDDNLEYLTPIENVQHAIKAGRTNKGERNGSAKLTADKVRQIRAIYANGGASQSALARQFGIGQYAIWRIVNRRGWEIDN